MHTNIPFDKIYERYKTEGNSVRFQLFLVKSLRPLTEVFCKKANVQEFYYGELKSYLYAGYLYAIETFDETKGRTLSTWLYGIAQNRMLTFWKNLKIFKSSELPKQVWTSDTIEDNAMNEYLLQKLLHDAGIDGLDYEVYVRKKGVFGYREMTNVAIKEELGIEWHTLESIMRKNKIKLCKYKKKYGNDTADID